MKIALVYFSQTGNTKKVTDTIAETLKEKSHEVKSLALQEATHQELLKHDLFAIGTPTFESHAPTNVKNFIKSLPIFPSHKAFVFATGGGAAGNVLYDMTRLLRKKNVHVLSGFFTIGQMNHPAPCIFEKSKNHPTTDDLDKAKQFASGIHDLITNNSKQPIPYSRPDALKQKYGFYNIVGFIGTFDRVIQLLVPKPKHNKHKCNQCGICAKECPMHAITMNPYPAIDNNCVRCYRCQNICPNKAFSTNWLIGNIVVLSLWNTFFMRLFGEYDK